MQTLLADSGSTKTDWIILESNTLLTRFSTQGINPILLHETEIIDIFAKELFPVFMNNSYASPNEITFYGAGCRGKACKIIENSLRHFWPNSSISVNSDLLGAARCTSLGKEAIVCILGTGSNSCHFDGYDIIDNVPPMGFILGDEGSGASLGKRLVSDIAKRQLSEEMTRAFFDEHQLTIDEIVQRVYRSPLPNRFLASLTHFLHCYKEKEEVRNIILEEFHRFFSRNIAVYEKKFLPLYFVGSIAWFFAEELQTTAAKHGYEIRGIYKTPFDAMLI